MSATAWSTIANLATALGTLILAVPTFSAVRSSNLMARVAREQLLSRPEMTAQVCHRESSARSGDF